MSPTTPINPTPPTAAGRIPTGTANRNPKDPPKKARAKKARQRKIQRRKVQRKKALRKKARPKKALPRNARPKKETAPPKNLTGSVKASPPTSAPAQSVPQSCETGECAHRFRQCCASCWDRSSAEIPCLRRSAH